MKAKMGVFALLTALVIGLGAGLVFWFNNQNQSQAETKPAAVSSSSVKPVKPKPKKVVPKKKRPVAPKNTAATRKIDAVLRANRFVGTALVVRNGKTVYEKGFGYANYALQRKNGINTEYQLASVQKSFTAGLIMKLAAAKKLALTDNLAKYYPQINGAQQITLRDMLDMKSGLTLVPFPDDLHSETGMIKFILKNVNSDPAKIGQWNYAPVNYMLLAGIIRKVSGQSYQQYFTQNITQAFGLKHTGFVFNMNRQRDYAQGYENEDPNDVVPNYRNKFPESRASMYYQYGTGQVYMSARDLYVGERDMLQGKLYPQADVNTLLTPGSASTYGGGDYIQPGYIRVHGLAYGHEATALLSKDGQDGVVLLTNYYRVNQLAQTPAIQIWNLLEAGQLGK
ncbi:serine hydrolase domain-containing protein [Levilactobacillus zymae]|uniref:Beta-lactamase class C and other penicillin binding proteins n=1 Tax=Levilactobacillus zymae TaxID=267363 RepID=A0A1Y6JYG7_9LACO|nr:serine hydrolase domain-containing protein [Levilactobacillus zymae]KRL13551.1 Beta-lactamase class C related penicillin binding protein [Levilactobacillus zymae DSM 19395]QFR61088.1 serine hydrolase [Levilactobacillus zymae]GEO72048.1 peptidase S12 [Levilactobacillus zymae]SMS13903.1 Beta-lactamase class C and other penicillin binding proteins [Levilactobacillus zymae]